MENSQENERVSDKSNSASGGPSHSEAASLLSAPQELKVTPKHDDALPLPKLSLVHQIDAEEETALKSGSVSLATALESEARKVSADPDYLNKNYGHIAAAVHIPLNDGSGDDIYMRAVLYAVELKKDADASAISFDEFGKQRINPAAEDALRSMRFTGKVFDSANLNLTIGGNPAAEISSQIGNVEAFRMSKNGDIPQSIAESIASDTFPLVIHQPTKDRWLNALHNDALRLSQTSPQFQNELREKLADFQKKGISPETDILAGSVIDIKVRDANGRQTAEIIASPDKPTVYNEEILH